MDLNSFSSTSRVWIYPANRELTAIEVEQILTDLNQFVAGWDSHGTPLKAQVELLEKRFVTFIVDEAVESPSGCSIDRSVKKMKELGAELKINFFDRLQMVVQKGNERKQIHFSELGDYKDWMLFNPLVANLAELETKFLIPVEESSFV